MSSRKYLYTIFQAVIFFQPYECDAEKEARKRRMRTRSENQTRATSFPYYSYSGSGRKRRASEGDESYYADDTRYYSHHNNRIRRVSGPSKIQVRTE